MDLLRRAGEVLAQCPEVVAAYGFGSRARGTARPQSDLDVAIVTRGRLSLRERLRLQADISEAVGLPIDRIDLVVLADATPLVKREAISDGMRLFPDDDPEIDRFEARVIREYLDTAHLRSTVQRLMREAVQ